MPRTTKPEDVGLPPTPFLYTIDQVASLINMDEAGFTSSYIWYLGRSGGAHTPRKLKAVNIAPELTDIPDWRISEQELMRWFRVLGFRVYSRIQVV